MATRRNNKKKLSQGQNRLLKESLRELLGSGLLESKEKPPMNLFFLKGALNSQLLGRQKN